MTTLGMFARYPEPGCTKTRLAATIGDVPAADLYACFVQDLMQRTASLADEQWIAVTPESKPCLEWFESLCREPVNAERRLMIQPDGDLGQRIAWFFREAAQRGRGPAVLIGTDSPDLPTSRINQAFELLSDGSADVVMSPAADGGFVLIGLRGDPGSLFQTIRWSSPQTLLDTLKAAQLSGKQSILLPAWYDVDHIENLGTLAALQRQPGLTEAAPCPLTADRLEQLMFESEDG